MKVVLVWKALAGLIESHYHKSSSNGGRQAYLLVTIVRVHMMQHWYEFSDPSMVWWVSFA